MKRGLEVAEIGVLACVLVEVGGPGRGASGRLQGVDVRGGEVGWPGAGHPAPRQHGGEVGVGEVGVPGCEVDGGVEGVDVRAGQVGGAHGPQAHRGSPWRRAGRVVDGVGPGGDGPSHVDHDLAILTLLRFRVNCVPAVDGEHVRVDVDSRNPGCGVGESLHHQHLGCPVLVEDEKDGVPDDGLQHHELDH